MIKRGVSKIRKWSSGRPMMSAVLAFCVVVGVGVTLCVWWNLLLVQQHDILKHIDEVAKQVAAQPEQQRVPLALLMLIGIGLSAIAILGLVYLFMRLIQTLRLNLAQNQFIATVTHELRSPVAGMQVLFDTLSQPNLPAEKRKQFEESIRKELKRLRDLVDQVLDTARLEHALTKMPLEPISLEPFLQEAIQRFDVLAKSLGGTIGVEALEPSRVLGHRKLLGMVVSNLLDNAIKYSLGSPQITIRAREEGDWARIEVEDRGIGLTRPEQKKIFRRFFRAQNAYTQTTHGTGLGLYFTKLAVSAQGGKIQARSGGPGRGSTFSLQMRLLRESTK